MGNPFGKLGGGFRKLGGGFKRLGGALGDVAPALAGIVLDAAPGGSVVKAALAKSGIKTVARIVGVSETVAVEEPETLVEAIGEATPEQLVEIRKADAATRTSLRRIGLEEARVAAADRKDARARFGGSIMPAVVTLLLVGSHVGISVWLLVDGGPADTDLVLMVYGSLATAAGMCVSYWMGSSRTQDSAHEAMTARGNGE